MTFQYFFEIVNRIYFGQMNIFIAVSIDLYEPSWKHIVS